MARTARRIQALVLLALFAAPFAHAQLTSVPDLSTATATTATTDGTTPQSTTDASTTAATTDAGTTAATTTDNTQTTTTATFTGLSDVPTIAGAGIPTLYIPYTADAPFMRKSNYPQGTVFIAVGAVLAFMGACVLFWRAMVAWSINRSVKQAALASIRGSEKTSTWGGSSGYNPVAKSSLYRDAGGSSMSLDALTSAGKLSKPHFRDPEMKRESTPPPADLFFSPTAQAGTGARNTSTRNSAYLPAGYYASPSAQAAGGAGSTTIGGSLAPYARTSTYAPSPPDSPGLPPRSRGSLAPGTGNTRGSSRDGLGASRESYRGGLSARNSYLEPSSREQRQSRGNGLYAQSSSGALSSEHLGGSRAPSAYLEDLFENHGNGPRERF